MVTAVKLTSLAEGADGIDDGVAGKASSVIVPAPVDQNEHIFFKHVHLKQYKIIGGV